MKRYILPIFIAALLTMVAIVLWQSARGKPTGQVGPVTVETPKSASTVSSPLVVTGYAPGTWFFEASLSVLLKDANGNTIASAAGQAQGEWMTNEQVRFQATLDFDQQSTETGTLVIAKNNPSGLPENADGFSIPVKFKVQGSGGGGILPYQSGIRGIVLISPTCPVEHNPPERGCEPKPYEADIFVERAGKTFATTHAGKDGKFSISAPPGQHIVGVINKSGQPGLAYPFCERVNVTVGGMGYADVTINCDTGIR